MTSPRIAKSLDVLRSQVNAAWPKRDKTSDGWIASPEHLKRSPVSDHNPNKHGVVCALDITNDPRGGIASRTLAERILASGDTRLNYVISNDQIAFLGGRWNAYQPNNPNRNTHRLHCHISVTQDETKYDIDTPWRFEGIATVPTATNVKVVSQVGGTNVGFGSLVEGGFYSDDPLDLKVKTSIRTNNPGALNVAPWVKAYPGYVGDKVTSMSGASANSTVIFQTPEHGVAAWWELLYRYRIAGAKTVGQIVNRYGGGQDYSAYTSFVSKYAGLPATYEIKLTGDDANLLKFANAMFRYEAGEVTPVKDVQILYGFDFARQRHVVPGTSGATTSTIPLTIRPPTPISDPAPPRPWWQRLLLALVSFK